MSKLNLSADEKIFIIEDSNGYGTSRPEYEHLHSILLYFYDREKKTPEEELLSLLKDPMNIWMRNAVKEGQTLLARPDFPWRYIKSTANYSLLESNEPAVRAWLEHILQLIEENLPASPKNLNQP